MSPAPTTTNPSQAVERIREIIVGRHLEKIELRVARLESGMPVGSIPAKWEEQLATHEARLEALQQSVQKLAASSQEESAIRQEIHREEIQRLANQIQQVAALKSAEAVEPAVLQLEQKIGSWLTHWQGALQNHLADRENRMATELRQEVATLWEHTESQLTRLQSRAIDRDQIEERFKRIAEAARALADCAYPANAAQPASGTATPTP